ncbi:MAG: hypothetical protein JW757_09075 [Anaerolineales bacterium]|nr:hypothetical protein [Anaerolineales bacterium]
MLQTKSNSWINLVLLGVLFAASSLLASRSVRASVALQDTCPQLDWREKTTGSFVILYTINHIQLAEEIQKNTLPVIEDELTRLQQALGQSLVTPITIRIYPSEAEYYCLNAFAPAISSEDFHSHIGSREIALLAEVINLQKMYWETYAVNAFRHQVAVLYGELISDGAAPPGLLQGFGGYLEDPAQTFNPRYQAAGEMTAPDRSWQRLLEEDIPASDAVTMFQQTSLVAFLIDLYGWDDFMAFLTRIPEVQGYRQAILDVYGVNLQDLQDYWVQYFPVYVQHRWQANVIHNYDLTQYDQLIAGGAYSDAQAQIKAALPLIELFGNQEKVERANHLLEKAGVGVEASALALAARQSILDGDFQTGLGYADRSLQLYQQLGDTRRETEIELYRQICTEVLALRAEVEKISGNAAPLDPVRTEQLILIGQRLAELGDREGTQQVRLALLLLGIGQQNIIRWVTVIGVLLSAFLIWRRFWAALRQDYGLGDLL